MLFRSAGALQISFDPDTGSNDSSSFSNSAGTYTLNNFDPEFLTSLTFYAQFSLTSIATLTNGADAVGNLHIRILQNGTQISENIVTIPAGEEAQPGVVYPNTATANTQITLDTTQLSNNDVFKAQVRIETDSSFVVANEITATAAKFGVQQQNPAAGTGLSTEFEPTGQTPYWVTGSTNGDDDGLGNTIITASN